MAKKKAKATESKEEIIAKANKLISRGKALQDNDIVMMGLDLLESVGAIAEVAPTQAPQVEEHVFKSGGHEKIGRHSLGKKDRPPRIEQLQVGKFVNNWNPADYERDVADSKFDKAVTNGLKKVKRTRSKYKQQYNMCEKCGNKFATFSGSSEYACPRCIGG